VKLLYKETTESHRQPPGKTMDARRHGQEGALAPPPFSKCCKVFLCISSYSKTLSGRIIYALFSQPVVGFWGLRPADPNSGSIPGPRWRTLVHRPLICPPLEKNPAGAHG